MKGVGITTIKPFCRIKTDNVIIDGHRVRESKIRAEDTPLVETSAFLFELQKLFVTGNVKIPPIESPKVLEFGSNEKLDELSIGISELEAMQRSYDAEVQREAALFSVGKRSTIHTILACFIVIIICTFLKFGKHLISCCRPPVIIQDLKLSDFYGNRNTAGQEPIYSTPTPLPRTTSKVQAGINQ